jgi:hypothetical protein
MVLLSKYSSPNIPMQINLSGDKERSRSLINFAKQQVARLREAIEINKFSKLSSNLQNKHIVLNGGEKIDIQLNHGLSMINIYSPIKAILITEKEVYKEKMQELGMVNVLWGGALHYLNNNNALWYEDLNTWNSHGGSASLVLSTKILISSIPTAIEDGNTVEHFEYFAPFGMPEGLEYINFIEGFDVKSNWTDLDYWTKRISPEIKQYGHTYTIKFYYPYSISGPIFHNYANRIAFQSWLTENGYLHEWYPFQYEADRWLKQAADNSYWSI